MIGLGMMELIVIAVLGGGTLIALVVVLVVVMRSGKTSADPDAYLDETLAEYPPPPKAGTHTLQFEGQPMRLRLVVLAPAGRGVTISADMAEGLLQAVMHGLGEVADLDKPRIKIWPGQLSVEGFAPKFFDNVARPERPGQPSRWVLLAGPAKAGQKTICVGLALLASEPTARGNVRMTVDAWHDKLRVKVVQ